MVRSPSCSKEGLSSGAWSAMEDMNLSEYIRIHSGNGWKNIPKKAGLKRCGKSCRLRWLTYLRPDIKCGNISPDKEELIIRLHRLLGNRWSLIAGRLPGRTDNEIKNYWNTHMGKKLCLSMNKSQPRTSENRRTRSKSRVPVQNPVFKATTIKIKIVVRHCGIVRANGYNDEGSSNHISDETFKLWNVQETRKSSWRDLLVNNSIRDEEFERIGLPLADNAVEIAATHFLCSMSSLGYQQSPHYDYSGGDAVSLAESSLFSNKQSSQYCNLLPSLFVCSTDFTSEDLYRAMEKDYNNEQDGMYS